MCIYIYISIYLYITWAFSLCNIMGRKSLHGVDGLPLNNSGQEKAMIWWMKRRKQIERNLRQTLWWFAASNGLFPLQIQETPRKTRSSQPLLTWGPQPGIDHWDRGAGTTGGQKKMIEMKIDLSVPQQTMLKWELYWESLRNPQGMKPNMKLSGRFFLRPILGNQLKYGSQLQTNQIWVNLSRN